MLKTKSLGAPAVPGDGLRVLIARYRPRGVPGSEETWQKWDRRLAPSVALVDAFYGKRRVAGRVVARGLPPLPWPEYAARFNVEMKSEPARQALVEYARRAAAGETITLLCHCADESHCHRSIVARMIRARQSRVIRG